LGLDDGIKVDKQRGRLPGGTKGKKTPEEGGSGVAQGQGVTSSRKDLSLWGSRQRIACVGIKG